MRLFARAKDFINNNFNFLTFVIAVVAALLGVAAWISEQRFEAQVDANNLLTWRFEQLGNENTRLIEQTDRLTERLASTRRSLNAAESAKERLDGQLSNLSDGVSTLRDEVSALEGRLERATDRELTARRLAGERLAELQRQISLSAADQEEITRLRARIANFIGALGDVFPEEIQAEIERLNEGLRIFQLVPVRLELAGWNVIAAYRLERNERYRQDDVPLFGLINFQSEMYSLPNGLDCNIETELCRELCPLIDEATDAFVQRQAQEFRTRVRRLSTLEERINVEQAIVAELVAIWTATNRISSNVNLFLRGYADGQAGEWKRQLEPNETVRSVSVFSPDEETCQQPSIECWRFDGEEVITFPENYENADLPNLRSASLREDIGGLVGFCNATQGFNTETLILDGVIASDLGNALSVPVRTVSAIIVLGEPLQ